MPKPSSVVYTGVAATVSKPTTNWASLSKRATPYLLVLPALAVVAVTVFYPIAWAVSLSTHQFVLYRPNDTPFVGLGNFERAFADEVFWLSLQQTGIWVVAIVVSQLFLGFFGALALNEPYRGRGLVRAVVLIPWITPSILTALMWRWMYNVNYGVINHTLVGLGLLPRHVGFLSEPDLALFSVIAVVIWSGTPFFTVMLLAAMQAIPDELYEAAKIDGASAVQRVRYVTIPFIAPTIAVTSLLRIIWVANYVDVLFAMTGGGPGYASMTLPVYIFIKAQAALDMGYGSAMALCLAAILIAIVSLYLWMLNRLEVQVR